MLMILGVIFLTCCSAAPARRDPDSQSPNKDVSYVLPISKINLENKDQFQAAFAQDIQKIGGSRAEEIAIRRLFCSGLQKYADHTAVRCFDTLEVVSGDIYDTLLPLPRDGLLSESKLTFSLPTRALLKKLDIISGFVILINRPVFSSVYFPSNKDKSDAESMGIRLNATFIVWNVTENKIESMGDIYATRTTEMRSHYPPYVPYGTNPAVIRKLWAFTTDRAAVQVAYGTPRFRGEKAKSYYKLFGPGPW